MKNTMIKNFMVTEYQPGMVVFVVDHKIEEGGKTNPYTTLINGKKIKDIRCRGNRPYLILSVNKDNSISACPMHSYKGNNYTLENQYPLLTSVQDDCCYITLVDTAHIIPISNEQIVRILGAISVDKLEDIFNCINSQYSIHKNCVDTKEKLDEIIEYCKSENINYTKHYTSSTNTSTITVSSYTEERNVVNGNKQQLQITDNITEQIEFDVVISKMACSDIATKYGLQYNDVYHIIETITKDKKRMSDIRYKNRLMIKHRNTNKVFNYNKITTYDLVQKTRDNLKNSNKTNKTIRFINSLSDDELLSFITDLLECKNKNKSIEDCANKWGIVNNTYSRLLYNPMKYNVSLK